VLLTKFGVPMVRFYAGNWAVFGGSGCKPLGEPADGDNSLKLSVGVEKVPEKNETATDFRL
jgi:hypothetical protein